MIDNFDLIYPLFYFNKANHMFMHLQIIRRKKDNEDTTCSAKLVATYLVRSREHLEKIKEEVIMLCEKHKARAYINVAGKDFSTLNNELLFELSLSNKLNNLSEKNPYSLINSCVGKIKSRKPVWIIDIDTKDEVYIRKVVRHLRLHSKIDYHIEIPTKNGVHLLTTTFDRQKFKVYFPDIDVHTNNPTLLYLPNLKDNEQF